MNISWPADIKKDDSASGGRIYFVSVTATVKSIRTGDRYVFEEDTNRVPLGKFEGRPGWSWRGSPFQEGQVVDVELNLSPKKMRDSEEIDPNDPYWFNIEKMTASATAPSPQAQPQPTPSAPQEGYDVTVPKGFDTLFIASVNGVEFQVNVESALMSLGGFAKNALAYAEMISQWPAQEGEAHYEAQQKAHEALDAQWQIARWFWPNHGYPEEPEGPVVQGNQEAIDEAVASLGEEKKLPW